MILLVTLSPFATLRVNSAKVSLPDPSYHPERSEGPRSGASRCFTTFSMTRVVRHHSSQEAYYYPFSG